ncbi:hypothetical protein [uncultured Campylobacter sp.]|uniref:hypothetical protein n=1 Tax=uncultured Campylobacter sp. TaxID=218934 RepID=UPI00261A5329|nr:hypothetical protein [uncultured Campylobacter sp.]
MKKGKILLSLALLCSPFWLAAAQNESSRLDAASQSSTPPASNFAANNAAPKILRKSQRVLPS